MDTEGKSLQRQQLGDSLYSWLGPLTLLRHGVLLLGEHGAAGVRSVRLHLLTMTTERSLDGGRYAPEPARVCLIMLVFILGIWLHHTADTQVRSEVDRQIFHFSSTEIFCFESQERSHNKRTLRQE